MSIIKHKSVNKSNTVYKVYLKFSLNINYTFRFRFTEYVLNLQANIVSTQSKDRRNVPKLTFLQVPTSV